MSDFFTLGVSTLWRSLENIPGEEVHSAHRIFHEAVWVDNGDNEICNLGKTGPKILLKFQ